MKTLVLSLVVGPKHYQEIADVSQPGLKAYAEKIGADFEVCTELGSHVVPGYAKLDAIRNALKTYDRVLFVDADILVRYDAPNLFAAVPDTHVGVYNEGRIFSRHQAKASFFSSTGLPPDQDFITSRVYYNTGVLVVSKCHANLFIPVVGAELDNFGEQTLLNYRFNSRGTPVHDIDYKCNRLFEVTKHTGEQLADCFFLHFAGAFSIDPRAVEPNLDHFRACASLFDGWRQAGKVPYLPKNIFAAMGGGLGDQVATEPLIRYMSEVLYPDDNFVVQTHHPEILAHLPRVKPLKAGDTVPNIGYFQVSLMPDDSRPSFNLCHPLDFVSLKGINGQLLNGFRSVKLKSDAVVFPAVAETVAIHPGNGWPSKTFPVNWWDAVIKLINRSAPVVLIGTDTVGVAAPEWGTDLRGKTSLSELIRVIELAPCLVTNDSSPVHIAGAFENPCVLIPTCKHPDHIFPYRSPELNIALGKPFNPYPPPTQLNDILMDGCTDEQLAAALPDPEEVARVAIEAYQKRRGTKWTSN